MYKLLSILLLLSAVSHAQQIDSFYLQYGTRQEKKEIKQYLKSYADSVESIYYTDKFIMGFDTAIVGYERTMIFNHPTHWDNVIYSLHRGDTIYIEDVQAYRSYITYITFIASKTVIFKGWVRNTRIKYINN